MNNDNYTIDKISQLLEPELNKLVQTLKSGSVPTADKCEKLCELLTIYKETAKAKQKKCAKTIRFVDCSYEAGGDKDKAILKNESVVNMLCKVGLEKIVSIHDADVNQELIRLLADAKLIASINSEDAYCDDNYFVLTTKGWAWMASKEFEKQVENRLSVFPAQLTINPNIWNELTFQRAKMIRAYYRNTLSTNGYMMFAFPNNDQLLFGCEVSDTIDVSYVFPYVFDDVPSEKDLDMLCTIISTQEIKKLVF